MRVGLLQSMYLARCQGADTTVRGDREVLRLDEAMQEKYKTVTIQLDLHQTCIVPKLPPHPSQWTFFNQPLVSYRGAQIFQPRWAYQSACHKTLGPVKKRMSNTPQ